tara:strand:+ start:251 stop:550 length:300 start_codon:yes stop_codon:yes gene_type:complete
MTLPSITEICLIAQIEKVVQTDPQDFAHDTMMELKDEQPALVAAIMSLLLPIMKSERLDPPTVELILQTTFCILGVAMKATNAQIEANEMEAAWGEQCE